MLKQFQKILDKIKNYSKRVTVYDNLNVYFIVINDVKRINIII